MLSSLKVLPFLLTVMLSRWILDREFLIFCEQSAGYMFLILMILDSFSFWRFRFPFSLMLYFKDFGWGDWKSYLLWSEDFIFYLSLLSQLFLSVFETWLFASLLKVSYLIEWLAFLSRKCDFWSYWNHYLLTFEMWPDFGIDCFLFVQADFLFTIKWFPFLPL